jgi:phage terminase small subunit
MAKLSERQKRFCDEYMIDLNGTQAYIRAGYSTQGAATSASTLLGLPHVNAEIDRRKAAAAARVGVTADRIIRELARIAFGNAVDIINEDGSINLAASRDDTAAIVGVKVKRSKFGDDGESVEKEVKLADKLKALELLGKHTGILTDKVDVNLTGSTIKIALTGDDEDDETAGDDTPAGDDGES